MSLENYLEQVNRNGYHAIDEKNVSTNELIENNLQFVVKMAHGYKHMLDFDELIQAGNYGLITAAQRYDRTKDSKFITYAVFWIKKFMRNAIADTRSVQSSVKRVEMLSLDEPMQYEDGNNYFGRHEKIQDDRYKEYSNLDMPDELLMILEERKILYTALDKLEELEKNILKERYGLNDDRVKKNLLELSIQYGMTIPGIFAIEKRSMIKLKEIIRRHINADRI